MTVVSERWYPGCRAARVFTLVLMMVTAASSCATTGTTGGALRSRGVGTDDLVVLRRHSDVIGVAASSRHVYALSTQGLLVYDRVLAHWRAPSSRVDGDLELAGVVRLRNAVLAADPVEDAVWIGVPGAVVLYRTQVEQVQRVTIVGQPEVIAFTRGSADAYVRASGQWLRVSRAGFVTPLVGGIGELALVVPPQLDDVYRLYPALRGQLSFLLRDPSAGSGGFASVSSGTYSPDQASEVWIGTRSDGLWRVDANFLRADQLRYGVLDDAIGAIAQGGDGVWSGGQGMVRGGGLSFVANDLQRFAWVDGTAHAALGGVRITALAVRANRLWSGTDRGVVRVRLSPTTGVTQWGTLHGLPSELVTAIVPRDDGAWIATSRGLAFLLDTSSSGPMRGDALTVAFAGQPVRSLLLVSDTLVIGTDDGLSVMSARVPSAVGVRAVPRPLFAGNPALSRTIQALAWSDSLLLIVTARRALLLSRRDAMRGALPGTSARVDSVWWGEPIPQRELVAVGAVVAAAMDARSIWIAGARGVLALTRDGGALRVMYAGSELPGDVTALSLGEEWAWIGTNRGLVRVRRSREGGLP